MRRPLTLIGEPAEPPRIHPARGCPLGTNRPSRPYPTGTQWRLGIQNTSPTSGCGGSRLPSPASGRLVAQQTRHAHAPRLYLPVPPPRITKARDSKLPSGGFLPVSARGPPRWHHFAQPLQSTFLRCYVPRSSPLTPSRRAVGFPNRNGWTRPVCPIGAFHANAHPDRSGPGRRVLAAAAAPP